MNIHPQIQTDTTLLTKVEPSAPDAHVAPSGNQAALASPMPEATDLPPGDATTPFAYRGKGKVARLPKTVRDQINHWMLDGLGLAKGFL